MRQPCSCSPGAYVFVGKERWSTNGKALVYKKEMRAVKETDMA